MYQEQLGFDIPDEPEHTNTPKAVVLPDDLDQIDHSVRFGADAGLGQPDPARASRLEDTSGFNATQAVRVAGSEQRVHGETKLK